MKKRGLAGILAAAICSVALMVVGFAEPAYAQGRALACVEQSGFARTATLSEVGTSLDGFTWESLMDVSNETLDASGLASSDSSVIPGMRAFSVSGGAVIVEVHSDTLSTEELVAQLASRPGVLFAEADRMFTAGEVWGAEYASSAVSKAANLPQDIVDPKQSYTGFQWFLKNEGLWASGVKDGVAGPDVSLPLSLPLLTSARIAVLDSGVSSTNPSLKDRIGVLREYPKFKEETGCSDYGYNASAAVGESLGDSEDYVGHGTHVAGIAAAGGAVGTSGVSGQAPVEVVPVRVCDVEGNVQTSSIVRGINWLVKANIEAQVGIKAVNISIGGSPITKSELLALRSAMDAGIIPVYGSANDNADMDAKEGPVSIDTVPGMLAVNALDAAGNKAAYSNYGQKNTDLFAPGSSIFSTLRDVDASFNPYAAAANTRASGDGMRSFVYESFEGAVGNNNPDPSINGLTLRTATFDAEGKPVPGQQLGEESMTSDQWFWGKRSLAVVDDDGDGRIALLSDPVDLTQFGADASKQLYTGVSAFANGGMGGVSIQYRLSDGTFSTAAAATVNANASQWRASSSSVPAEVDLKQFQLLITIAPSMLSVSTSLETVTEEDPLTVYLDCIGVGVGRERYGVQGGTSMAAPCVTGTLGLLASAYPNESALELSARILGGTDWDDELDTRCSTGGRLNVDTALNNPNPALQQLHAEGGKALLQGWFFGEGDQITVAGNPVLKSEWKTDKEGMVSVTFTVPEGVSNGVNEVVVEAADGRKGRAFFDFAAVKKPSGFVDLPIPDAVELVDARLTVAGDTVLLLTSASPLATWPSLHRFDIKQNVWSGSQDIPLMDPLKNYDPSEISWGEPAVHQGRLYAVLSRMDASLAVTTWLASYDPATGAWSCTDALGDALMEKSLVSWKGKLCAVGGSSGFMKPALDTVTAVDPATGAQELIGHLPLAANTPTVRSCGEDLIVIVGMPNPSVTQNDTKDGVYVTNLTDSVRYAFPTDTVPVVGTLPVYVPVHEGLMMVGLKKAGEQQSDTAILDKETGTWTWTEKVCSTVAPFGLASAQQGDKAYIWGYSGGAPDFYFFRSTDVHDANPDPALDPTSDPEVTPIPSALAKAGDGSFCAVMIMFILLTASFAALLVARSFGTSRQCDKKGDAQ